MKRSTFILIILGIISVQGFLLIKMQFTAWPEMLLWPYLMLKGWMPYRDIAIAHNPMLLLFLSGFYSLFGVGVEQLRIFTYILIAGMDILVLVIASKLFNKKAGLWSLLFFIFLQIFYEGNDLWFDFAMGIFALISFYFLRMKSYFWAGLLLGLAFMTKQTAVWFVFPIIFLFILKIFKKQNIENFYKFILGGVFVFIISFVILEMLGIWKDYLYWAVEFGIFTLPAAAGQINLPTIRQIVVYLFPFSILLIYFLREKRNWELPIWAIAGFMGAYPRFELFHFQPALPFLAISAGVVMTELTSKQFNKAILVRNFIFLYLTVFSVLFFRSTERSWRKEVRFYENNVRKVAKYVKSQISPDEPIYVFNYWDNIYALTDTLPATKPWIPDLPWYIGLPGVQEGIVEDLEGQMPQLIIVGEFTDTGLSSYRPEKITNFIGVNYKVIDKVGDVDVFKSR